MNRSSGSIVSRNWVVGVTLSAGICLHFCYFGSFDVEDSLNASFSVAAGLSESPIDIGTRDTGTASHWGVPVFDALQGIGGRLPYQASWSQSPEWPMRFVLSDSSFVVLRVFLASLVMFVAAFRTLSSWKPQTSWRELIILGSLLCAPFGVYLRLNDWTDKYSITAGVSGISFLLLDKGNFRRRLERAHDSEGLSQKWILLFWCVAFVATGNPGYLPLAAIVLLPLALTVVASNSTWESRLRWLKRYTKVGTLVSLPALLTIGLVAIELLSEAKGAHDWDLERTLHTQGFFTDQAFVGVSRGMVPEFVERLAGVLTAYFVLPIVRILYENTLPVSQPTMMLTGSFPRGEFGGGLTVLAILVLYRRLHRVSPERLLLRTLVLAQAISFVLVFIAGNDLLPPLVTPSAAWGAFPVFLAVNVLTTFILTASPFKANRFPKLLLRLSVLTSGIWVLMQLSLLSIYPKPHFELPTQQILSKISTTEPNMNQVLSTGRTSRLAMASLERDSTADWAVSLAMLHQGKPVFAPVEQKIRNTNQLVDHAPTQSKLLPLSVDTQSIDSFDNLMDFLEIEHLLVRVENSVLQDRFRTQITELSRVGSGQDSIEIVDISGVRYILWTRSRFTSSVLRDGVNVGPEYCPVLKENCDVLRNSSLVSLNSVPRLSVCDHSCLWRYQVETINRGEILVIPVSFDEALVVENAQATALKTQNIGGFLGVTAVEDPIEGTLEIRTRLDWRMYSRVLVSYIYLSCFSCLTLICLRRTPFRRAKLKRCDASWG